MRDETGPISQLRLHSRFRVVHDIKAGWESVIPQTSQLAIQTLVEDFTKKGGNKRSMVELLRKATRSTLRDQKRLKLIVERGFKAEQVQLFLDATPKERQLLADAWENTLPARLKRMAPQAPGVVQSAVTTSLVGGSLGSLVFMTMGLIVHDGSMVETGRILLNALADTSSVTGPDMLAPPGVDRLIGGAAAVSVGSLAMGLVGLALKSSATLIQELLLKDDPKTVTDRARRDLEDRMGGVFSRLGDQALSLPKGRIDQDAVRRELKAIPDAFLPLLTHLQPKELVVFLVADEDARESMMRAHPPEAQQKTDVVRAMYSGKLRRSLETARQSMTAWDGLLSNGHGVTLASSLAAFRQARHGMDGQGPKRLAGGVAPA